MCNCNNTTTTTATTCKKCESIGCKNFIKSECITNVTTDLECSNIMKGQTLDETLVALDAYICTKFDSVANFFELINVGTTGAGVYKGVNMLGKKELRRLVDSNLINIVEGANDITISVDEEALSAFIAGVSAQLPSVFDFMSDTQIEQAKAMSTTQDLSSALNAAFASGNKTIRILGSARYTIGSPIYLTSNLTVLCDDSAEIYLKDMARCFMIQTNTTGLTNVKWIGGTINGNDVNQGNQVDDGIDIDVSKAFYLVNVNGVEVGNLTIKDIRGHGINHWNCTNFHFHDLKYDQTVDVIHPTGGKRRDGVTGSSSNGIIENISGYTNDDMVALLCGVPWAGGGTIPQNVENVQIRNIRGQTKAGQNTWRGCVLYTLDGYKMDNVSVSGIHGDFAVALFQIGSYGIHTTGVAGKITLSDFSGKAMRAVHGDTRVPIYIYNVDIDSLIINSGVIEFDDVYIGTGKVVSVDRSHINSLHINNLVVFDSCTTDVIRHLLLIKNNGIRDLQINNVSNYSKTFPDSGLKVIIYRDQDGGDGVGEVNVFGKSWNVGRETIGVTKANVFINGGNLTPFTSECCCSLLSITTPTPGSTLTDFNCGVVQYADTRWNQIQIPTRRYDQAIPTTGSWKEGFMFYTTGSPNNAVLGYLNKSSVAPFDFVPIPTNVVQEGSSNHFTNPLSTYAPGVTTVMQIGLTQSTLFPNGLPGILTTYSSTTSESFAYQEYRVRQSNLIWVRHWDVVGTTWTDFVQPSSTRTYIVATLPTGTQGDTAYVTDALTPTYLTTVVGGGAVVTPVFYDGISWKCH